MTFLPRWLIAKGSDGLILLASAVHQTLADIQLSDIPLVIILEGVEKPGNLGCYSQDCRCCKG